MATSCSSVPYALPASRGCHIHKACLRSLQYRIKLQFPLPARKGGLGILNPSTTSADANAASKKVTQCVIDAIQRRRPYCPEQHRRILKQKKDAFRKHQDKEYDK